MATFNMESARSPALLVAPSRGAVEVAAYAASTGDRMVCNANLRPFSPVDGTQMQLLSSERARFSERDVARTFVSVGKCVACDSNLIATASMADALETSGVDFHCPMCTAMVTPNINGMELVKALAAEFSDDDVPAEDEDADPSSESFTGDGDEDADDEDYAGGNPEAYDSDGDEYDEDEPDADEDDVSDIPVDSEADEDADDDETAAIRARMRGRRRRAYAADGVSNERPGASVPLAPDPSDPSPEMDGQDPEDAENRSEDVAFYNAVAAVRREIRRMGIAADGVSNERPGSTVALAPHPSDPSPEMDGQDPEDAENRSEDQAVAAFRARFRKRYPPIKRHLASSDDYPEDDGSERNDGKFDLYRDTEDEDGISGDEPDEVTEAAAALRPYVLDALAALGEDEQPIAGKPCDTRSIDDINENARASLRLRRGSRPDGNVHFKSQRALGGLDDNSIGLDDNIEGDSTWGENPETPGTNNEPIDDSNIDEFTPGTDEDPVDDSDTDEYTPGTEDTEDDREDEEPTMDGASMVDWANDKIEVVALQTDPNTYWVSANGRPVATLSKAEASATVKAQWGKPLLTSAFASACTRNLPVSEAKEFGFKSRRFRVKANAVMRKAMHNASRVATETAQAKAIAGINTYKQSVRSAMVAALKGTFADLKNPLRDTLVAKLSSLSVAEPRSVVDTAFASAVEPFLTGVFAKADEIASKPLAGRNEIAQIVATASYQSRVDDAGKMLAAKLASGGKQTPFASTASTFDLTKPAEASEALYSDKMATILRGIHRRRR